MRPGSGLPQRVVDKIEVGDCWLWTAATCGGYGRVRMWGRMCAAHIVVWELLAGPVPVGLTLDHLCRVTNCVNPDHLEPVTVRENILRGYSAAAKRARQTHCKRGHLLSGANLRIDKEGDRRCRTCVRNYDRGRKR